MQMLGRFTRRAREGLTMMLTRVAQLRGRAPRQERVLGLQRRGGQMVLLTPAPQGRGTRAG